METVNLFQYKTIYSLKNNTGIYSDDYGVFSVLLDKKDTLIISFLSYKKDTIPVIELINKNEILLRETTYSLNTLLVKSQSKRKKNYRIGFYDDPTAFDAWGITIGGMAVNYIVNNTERLGRLKTLLIDLGKASNQVHRAKARVRVFAAKNYKEGPGRDILNENIIFDIPRFSKHQKIDLSPFSIDFPLEGLFIGIEFLGFETKAGFSKDWKQQTGGRITSTIRDDYKSVGTSWRFPDTDGKLRWIPITDGTKHKNWEKILFKIGADVETLD